MFFVNYKKKNSFTTKMVLQITIFIIFVCCWSESKSVNLQIKTYLRHI